MSGVYLDSVILFFFHFSSLTIPLILNPQDEDKESASDAAQEKGAAAQP